MENASKALEIAFGVLVFVISLSIGMFAVSQARAVADVVFYTTDRTNFVQYVGDQAEYDVTRVVGVETIIPTIYRHYKEGFNVILRNRSGNIIRVFTTYTSYIPYTPPGATPLSPIPESLLLNKGKDYSTVEDDNPEVNSIVKLITEYLKEDPDELFTVRKKV